MGNYGSNYAYGASPLYKDEDYGALPILDFEFLPEWSSGISVKYGFDTTIFESKSYQEQRGGLRKYPIREISFSILENSPAATKAINTIIHYLQQDIVLPIFPEAFSCTNTGSLIGVTVITGALQYLYNLQTANRLDSIGSLGCLIVSDKLHTLGATVYDLSAISGTSLTLFQAISAAYPAARTIFYPGFACYLDSYSEAQDTDGLSTFDFTFKERSTWQIHSLT